MVFDPFDPAVKRDPYPFYADLRRHAPVHRVPAREMWAISRHADVAFALKRPDLFSSSVNADRAEIPARETLLGSDPPDHTSLRKRVEHAFSPRRIRALGPRMDTVARDLTAAFAARGSCDVIAELAGPLPVIVIAELMGVDPDRHADFKRWADAVIARGTGRPSSTDRAVLDARVSEFKTFLGDVIEARRRAPGDDLVSTLVREDGDEPGLTPAQALNFAVLLLLGGSETTTHLIGNAVRAVLADADLRSRVTAAPTPATIAAAVDEALRFDAPVQSVMRRTLADVTLADTRIPAGAIAILLLGSANRDELVFSDADQFRLDRGEANKQLAFGLGPHYCLGATLARMEARSALESLFALRNLRRARAEDDLVDSFVLRGPRSLDLAFD